VQDSTVLVSQVIPRPPILAVTVVPLAHRATIIKDAQPIPSPLVIQPIVPEYANLVVMDNIVFVLRATISLLILVVRIVLHVPQDNILLLVWLVSLLTLLCHSLIVLLVRVLKDIGV